MEELAQKKTLRTGRFAPAPSGNLHIGHLWTYLWNRKVCDRVSLRIDDTSVPRNLAVKWFESNRKLFKIFNMSFDRVKFQSDDLYESKLFLNRIFGAYYGHGCWSYALPSLGEYFDSNRGKILTKNLKELKDPVLLRSNGSPTYHLASIYDDHRSGYTDIVRSSDHVDNTFLHSAVFTALNDIKRFWHCPLIYDSDGEKLSKSRSDEWSLNVLLGKGLLPATLISYLEEHFGNVKRPFRLDLKRIEHLNRKWLSRTDYLIDVLPTLRRFVPVKIGLVRTFSGLLQSGRYSNLIDFSVEVNWLHSKLTYLHDRWFRNLLRGAWRIFFDNFFSMGEEVKPFLINLSVGFKREFRREFFENRSVPSTLDLMSVLVDLNNGCTKEKSL